MSATKNPRASGARAVRERLPTSDRSGILLIDKHEGITSHDAVAITRRAAGTRKVGHAGTLDPMATGLLVLGVNSSTRLLTFIVGLDKEYIATIRLGASTTTDDREGEMLGRAAEADVLRISGERLAANIRRLTGEIEQIPSTVSAIKVDGKRAYARARAGEDVVLEPRAVTVSEFEQLSSQLVREGADTFLDVEVRVVCSSGTYIRALARDLGFSLGVGGHLTALRRTRIGPFRAADASALTDLDVAASLLAPADVASALFPVARLSADQALELSQGKRPHLDQPDGGPVAALSPSGTLVGLVEISAGRAKSMVNFPPDPPFVPKEPATGEMP